MFIFPRETSKLSQYAMAFFRVFMIITLLLSACGSSDRKPNTVPNDEQSEPVTLPTVEPEYYDEPDVRMPSRTSPVADAVTVSMPPERGIAPVEFAVVASPSVVNLGDEVTLSISISNNSGGAITDLTFTDQLESGIAFVSSASDAKVTSGVLSYNIDNIPDKGVVKFEYKVKVGALNSTSPNGEVWLHAVNLKDKIGTVNLTTQAVFGVGTNLARNINLATVQEEGGWVSVGEAAVYVPPEAIEQDALLMMTPESSADNEPEIKFELNMIETGEIATDSNGNPVEQRLDVEEDKADEFNIPVFLEVNFDQVASLEEVPVGQEPFIATYYEEYDIWVKVPILTVDYENNSAMVKTTHFSTWGAGLGSSLPQNGTGALLFDQPYTSLFTGAARYSVPIWTPAGRAGMTPSIALSYSSATVDGVLGDVQAPWVGAGWSIDSAEIVRKITTSSTGYGYENSFVLVLDGQMHELIRDTNTPSRFYVKRDSFLYIELHNEMLGNAKFNGNNVSNLSHEWWEVVTADGTRYYFGRNEDSEQMALMYGYSCTTGNPCRTPDGAYASLGYAGIGSDMVARRWRVDRVVDTHGNYMEYEYSETHPSDNTELPAIDRSSILDTISYTKFDSTNSNIARAAGYQVHFVSAPRSTNEDIPNQYNVWDLVDDRYLDKIEICYGRCDITDPTIIRTYDLGYSLASAPNSNGTLTLTSLDISGGGFDENGIHIDLTESATVHFAYENKPNRAITTGMDPFNYPRLTQIENGYGASMVYTYETDGRGTDSWYSYRVKSVRVESGLETAVVRSYAYVTPVYTGIGSNPNLGELIGYTTVTETAVNYKNNNSSILDTKHQFGTTGLDVGKELWVEQSSGGIVLQKTVNTYVTDNSKAPFSGWNFRYLSQTENYLRSNGSLVMISKTTFYRDPETGNLIRQFDYMGSTLYRKTFTQYVTNSAPHIHILDRVSRQVITDANTDGILSDTYYYYDDLDSSTPISKGDLVFTQTRINPSNQTIDMEIDYDDYGNAEKKRQYVGYGELNSPPDANASYQLTEIKYDVNLKTYPIETTNALGEKSITSYFFTLGVPYQVTDPNSWTTTTQYDGLGRVTSVTPPALGDQAGVVYRYPDVVNGSVSAPYAIEMQIYDELGEPGSCNDNYGGCYRSIWGIYDGLGRVIQNQVYDADSKQLLITDVTFNAQGMTEQQGNPYLLSWPGGQYVMPSWPSGRITFEYDALGRTTKVTAPGNLITQTSYDGLSTTVTDPNGNQTNTIADAFGRLVRVNENYGQAVYSTTYYTYDVANRLVQVTDSHSNLTTIQYDWAGRKTAMDDPDMGVWSYQYSPTGNLIRQTDARSIAIEFKYDELNRLVEKKYDNYVLAEYIYGNYEDQTAGMRLEVKSYLEGSTQLTSQTSWEYDDFGRTVTTVQTIGDQEREFITTSDWLGRPFRISYLDGEDITYHYDALGRTDRFESSADSATTLANLAYNAFGQIETMVLGNGAITVTNTYDNITDDENHPFPTYRLINRSAGSSSELMNFSYSYDNNGNITAITDTRPEGTATVTENQSFSYDSLNRLVYADAKVGTNYIYQQSYAYDEIGNILQVDTSGITGLAASSESDGITALAMGIGGRGTNASISYQQPHYSYQDPPDDPTPTPTSTDTNTPTDTDTPSSTPSSTATASRTPTASRTLTSTRTSTLTPTPKITVYTNTPHATTTSTPTRTYTPTITFTPSNTPTPTKTPTYTPTSSNTNTPSNTPSISRTPTISNTPTVSKTPTNSFTPSKTPTPSNTPTASNTPTVSKTFTNTSTPSSTPTLTTGMMAYWSFDSIYGTTVPDMTGRGRTATLYGGIQAYQDGVLNQAIRFDGVDDYVNVPYHADLAPAGSFVISAWINPETIATGRYTRILERSGVFVLRFNTNGQLEFRVEGLTPAFLLGPELPLNEWTMVTGIHDTVAKQLRLYVNGELVAVTAVTGTRASNTNPLVMGSSLAAERFKGKLDEVRFDNVLRSDEEIVDWPNSTAIPTFTPTASRTGTLSATPTPTSSATSTLTPTGTLPSETSTNTPTGTPTATPDFFQKYDFGTTTSLLGNGYTRVTNATLYSALLGYGWTDLTSLSSLDRTGPDDVKRDFVYSAYARVFRADLPNGTYTVNVIMGDKDSLHDLMSIKANGAVVASAISTTANQWTTQTFSVTVTGGKVELEFIDGGGSNANWVVNAIEISATGLEPTVTPGLPTVTPAIYTYSSQPNDTTGIDADINSANPTDNNNGTFIRVGELAGGTEVRRGLVRFDLSSIPANADILSVTLSLTVLANSSDNARDLCVYRVKKDWTEGDVTWEYPWWVPGASGISDVESSNIGCTSFLASEPQYSEKSWSLTPSEIEEMVNGDWTNYGFLIRANTESDDLYEFASSGNPTAAYRPRLVIEYSVPGLMPTPAPLMGSHTYTSQPDDMTGIDADINSASPTSNNNGTYIQVGEVAGATQVRRALIKFDFSSIPSNATITSAKLYLTVLGNSSDYARDFCIYRAKKDWTETGATWNSPWWAAGASAPNDMESSNIGCKNLSSSESLGTVITWDLTPSAIQEMVNGTWANYGFVIRANIESNDLYEFAASGNTTAAYRPKLVIEYSTYVATATPLPPMSAYTYSSQPDDATGIDADINSASPTVNNNGTYIQIGEASGSTQTRRGLIKFDLSSIPSNATITSATLYMTVLGNSSDNARDFCIYRVKKDWTETGATWNSPWWVAGAAGVNDFEGVSIGCTNLTDSEAQGNVIAWSLTPAAIQEMVRGSWVNRGFLIRANTEVNDLYEFAASGNATATYRPKLVIEYTTYLPTPTPAPTEIEFVSQPADTTGIDADINSASPTTNSNTTYLRVGELSGGTQIRRTLIKFDLSSIPSDATITSATISLTVLANSSDYTRDLCIYRLKRDWTETGVTWNSPWQTAGASGANDVESTNIGCLSFSDSEPVGTTRTWTLSASAIQELVNGTQANYGFLIRANTETDDLYEFASSGYSIAEYRPKIVIRYTTPSSAPTPTPTPTNWNNGLKTYTYSADKPHAVTSVMHDTGTPDTYSYDANGNMTCRVEGDQTYNQVYNAENRMAVAQLLRTGVDCPAANSLALTSATLAAWQFVYDGDGTRVKQVYTEYDENGASTSTVATYLFAGGTYEVQVGAQTTVKLYYAIAGQVVGMRTTTESGSELNYFLTDHLGSVVAVTNASGALVSQQRYLPFGEVRQDVGIGVTPTDFGYTFQRNIDAQGSQYTLGLMDYRARFYSSILGRFTQADTIVPNVVDTQTYNRYAYANNNPLFYTDPSGHVSFYPGGKPGNDIPKKPKMTPTATLNLVSGGTLSVLCGSYTGKIWSIGPGCPDDPQGSPMSSYTQDGFPEYGVYHTQYPGYVWVGGNSNNIDDPENYDPMDPFGGKSQQATTAYSNNPTDESVPLNIVGFSAGADSAVIQATLSVQNNYHVDKIVLLGPSFYSYGTHWNLMDNNTYVDYVRSLAVDYGVEILIYDDQGVAQGLIGTPNITVISFLDGSGHMTLPETRLDEVRNFLNYGVTP